MKNFVLLIITSIFTITSATDPVLIIHRLDALNQGICDRLCNLYPYSK